MTVVLYGASGYTGRLVAAELRRRGVEHVLSGRDPAKLEPLGAEHGTPVRAVPLDDEPGLRDLLADAGAVINCAGPFTLAGDALVRAAVDSGTHYVDSTGEQSFIQMVFERHGAAAERAGVALVPAVGFDYLPGDCIARLAAEGHEPLEELVIAYHVDGFGMSRGTLRSALEAMQSGGVIYDGRRLAPRAGRRVQGELRLPGAARPPDDVALPVGRGDHGPAPHADAPGRLAALDPHRGADPHRRGAAAVPAARVRARDADTAARPPPGGRRRCSPRARRRPTAAPPPGRSSPTRAAEDGHSSRAVVRGTDVYGLTAVILVHAATLLSAPDFDRAGALGPAAAFDPVAFLNFLGDHGVTWER